MDFNFKDVDVPQENLQYVKPGFWKMAPVKAELVKRDGKTSHLAITFEGSKGKLVDKFWLSTKSMTRLQYLHVGLYDKKLEKNFKSEEEIEKYFNTLFTTKKVEISLLVGGEDSNGKVYARLPFSNFIINDEGFEEGPFEVGSTRYNSVVTKNTTSQGAPTSNDTLVSGDSSDDFPWKV